MNFPEPFYSSVNKYKTDTKTSHAKNEPIYKLKTQNGYIRVKKWIISEDH
jgi:hypothetical protein